MPSRAMVPKMLVDAYKHHLWGTAMTPADAKGGGSIS